MDNNSGPIDNGHIIFSIRSNTTNRQGNQPTVHAQQD